MATMNEINLKVNVSYADSTLSEEDASKLTLFVLWGVLLPLVAVVGLVGNVLTMMVLWRREMNSTTILYMRGLVITDTGILILTVLTLSLIACANYLGGDALNYFKDVIYPRIYIPGYYMVMTLQQINVWITVSVSVERYIAICHPFRASRLISKKKTIAAMLGITLFSLIYNLPHVFATNVISCEAAAAAAAGGGSTVNNATSMNVTSGATNALKYSVEALMDGTGGELAVPVTTTPGPNTVRTEHTSVSTSAQPPQYSPYCMVVTSSDFGYSNLYTRYRTIMYLVIIYVLPFIALLLLNTFLIRELMMMQRRNANIGSQEENEANLSLVLILIVIVFIFCQTPGLISQFDVIPASVFFTWLGVSNLLFAANSAVNFLIYTAFGKKFRRVLLRVFRHLSASKSKRRRASSVSSCHAALTTYSTSNGNDAVEMNHMPPTYDEALHDNGGPSEKT